MKPHKLGVNANYLTKRRLSLIGNVEHQSTVIVSAIDALMGVDSVSLDSASGTLEVSYDASKRQFDDFVTIVKSEGCLLSTSRWQRFKRGWYRYFDQNVKENASQKPWSCH